MATLVVALVLLAFGVDAAFAKGGPLHLFDSQRTDRPTISQPVSPSDFRGCGRGRYRDLVRKSVEVRPTLADRFVSVAVASDHFSKGVIWRGTARLGHQL